jgi:hypothetical protein
MRTLEVGELAFEALALRRQLFKLATGIAQCDRRILAVASPLRSAGRWPAQANPCTSSIALCAAANCSLACSGVCAACSAPNSAAQ